MKRCDTCKHLATEDGNGSSGDMATNKSLPIVFCGKIVGNTREPAFLTGRLYVKPKEFGCTMHEEKK